MSIIVIAAVAKHGVIGKENDIPWHLPTDLKQFKNRTLGHPMVMGRRTWESFGSKPLPKRPHVVVSSQPAIEESEQVKHAYSLPQAIMYARSMAPERDVFIIGGQAIYEQSMEIADRMFITHIDLEIEGDRHFPDIDLHHWKPIAQQVRKDDVHPYTVVEYVRMRFADGDFR